MIVDIRILITFGGKMIEDDWERLGKCFWNAGSTLDLNEYVEFINICWVVLFTVYTVLLNVCIF